MPDKIWGSDMISVEALRRVIHEKTVNLEFYRYQIKFQTGDSSERIDMIDRLKERIHRMEFELIDLQANLKFLEEHGNED